MTGTSHKRAWRTVPLPKPAPNRVPTAFVLEIALRARLAALAEAQGMTVSALLRDIVTEAVPLREAAMAQVLEQRRQE